MLWLCIHLPQLPLEVFSRGTAYPEPPCAIVEGLAAQHVGLCNTSAIKHGIQSGMKLSAARVLVADLRTHARDLAVETKALQGIAIWAGQFSSLISLSPPQSVLLEVQGSLVLFRSLESLIKQISEGIKVLGYTGLITVAPTPLASLVFAKAQVGALTSSRADTRADIKSNTVATDLSMLQQELGRLSLKHLAFDGKVYQALMGMGVNTVADCLRLPRDGLARRFGPKILTRLDRLTGSLPDPQIPFSAPAQFLSCIELPSEVEEVEALLFALHRLFLELGGFLQSRNAGIQQFDIYLKHQDFETRLSLTQIDSGRNIEKMQMLLRERMERLQLRAPVLEISLQVDTVYELAEISDDLFGDEEDKRGLHELLERLRARLGEDSIQSVYQVAEHRPERAWRYGKPGEIDKSIRRGFRPLWLLSEPVRLQQRHGRPFLHGKLHLEPERERIESGWWDGGDVQRDYFIAQDQRQSRFWIFRDLGDKAGNWYLHGIFE